MLSLRIYPETTRTSDGREISRYVVGYRGKRIIVGAESQDEALRFTRTWFAANGTEPADLPDYCDELVS